MSDQYYESRSIPESLKAKNDKLQHARELLNSLRDSIEELGDMEGFFLKSFSAHDGGFTLEATTQMTQILASGLAELLKGYNAENFVVLSMRDSRTDEKYTVTVRRTTGLTVEEKYVMVLNELNQLKESLGHAPKKTLWERIKEVSKGRKLPK